MNIDDIRVAVEWLRDIVGSEIDADNASPQFVNHTWILAQAFMSHPYGVLKPLEWEESQRLFTFRAESVFGQYGVNDKWCWLRNDHPIEWLCDSIDHGKQLCESHYSVEMAKAFTRIGGGE